MTDNELYKNHEAWQENARLWQTYDPPLRPSDGDQAIYDLIFKSGAGVAYEKKALILGDCPEVRDLLAVHQYEITVVANNPNAIIAMNQLLRFHGEKKEKVVIMNWQEIDLPADNFDLVVSDWGLNSLNEWLDYSQVLYQAKKLLKIGSQAVFRINTFDATRKKRSPAEIMQDFSKSPKYKFSFLLELEMYSTISTYNPESYQIDLGKFYKEEITNAYHDKQLTFAEWQEFYYPFFTVTMTYPEKEEMEKLLNSFFKVEAIKYGNDYPMSGDNPFYLCKKIKQ
jgi:hypothetical protein